MIANLRGNLAPQHLDTVFSLPLFAVAEVDLSSGRIRRANARFCALAGRSEEELAALGIADILHDEDRAMHDDVVAALVRAGAAGQEIEQRYVRPDGEIVFVRVAAKLVAGAAGRLVGDAAARLVGGVAAGQLVSDAAERRFGSVVCFAALDVTEHPRAALTLEDSDARTLEDSEARFHVMADGAPVLLWRADAQNRGIWFNRAWLEFTGRTMEQELGYGWSDALHPEDRVAAVAHCRKHLARRQPFETEFRMRRHDGEYRWMLDRGVPVFDAPGHAFSGYIGSCTDITERKHAEEALREGDRRKNDFLATLAHELRNPLAPISNALQLLRTEELPDAERIRAREIIARQVRHMVSLVDDLLDVSRISTGRIRLKPERVDIRTAIENAVESSRPLIEAAHHELTIDLPDHPVYVDADATRLSQVILNLLNNAVRYTPRGGHIELTAARHDGHVVLRVRDSGVGIARHMLPHVFEMFVQGDRASALSQDGLGVGLTLARQLTELHGGRLEADSDGVGRGSEFRVHLPVSEERPRGFCELPQIRFRGALT